MNLDIRKYPLTKSPLCKFSHFLVFLALNDHWPVIGLLESQTTVYEIHFSNKDIDKELKSNNCVKVTKELDSNQQKGVCSDLPSK